MGRKFASAKSRSFADLNRQLNAEYEENSNRIKDQWADLDKHVPIHQLNQGSGGTEAVEDPINNQSRKRKKRNSDEFPKYIQREMDTTLSKKDLNQSGSSQSSKKKKNKKKAAKLNSSTDSPKINGADVLGQSPPSKRSRLTNGSALNGSNQHSNARNRTSSTNSNSSVNSLTKKQLVAYSQSKNIVEEETSTNYFVTTPSDEENAEKDSSDEEEGPFFVAQYIYNDHDSEDSEDYYGIDLDEESADDFEEENESFGESDANFIDDGLEENEISEDELDVLERKLRSKKHKRTAEIDSDISEDEVNGLLNDSLESDETVQVNASKASANASPNLSKEYDESDDSDFSANSDSESDSDEASSVVSADELNSLLEDITRDEQLEMESEEERVAHLEPEGLKLKPIGLTVDGYNVDESVRKFVRIQKDKGNSPEPSTYNLFCFSAEDEHSVYTAIKTFKWLVQPIGIQTFFEEIYGKRAMVIQRRSPDYYKQVFPTTAFYRMFQENFLEYGVNINIASYANGVRQTHNPNGRAYAGAIRSFIDQNKSVQCVNPQSFNQDIHYLCEILQDMFNCFVGANCYYTPKGSSGFAPHFDDIDAFLIQTEGQKHWKVYAPSDEEQWPLESSGNFTPEEMEERQENLVFDGVLKAGDVLYLPRGFIHCAKTDSKHDSLHVTISVAQKHSYSNLLENVVTKLLEAKIEEIPQLRKSLPPDVLDICGVSDSTYENDNCLPNLETPIAIYLQQFQIGLSDTIQSAVDDLGRDFMRKALPPLLTDYEKKHSIHGVTDQIPVLPTFTADTQIRFIRKHTQRLLFESESKAFLVHRVENSLIYEGRPEVIVDVPSKLISSVECLLKVYPNWESIEKLGKKLKTGIEVAQFLYSCGLLMVREAPQQKASPTKKATSSPTKQKQASPKKAEPVKSNKPKMNNTNESAASVDQQNAPKRKRKRNRKRKNQRHQQ
ncbi:Bifunctional lysine-specific demethylase and histidyl-hydroxylase [Aphelenchoides bicaudatus]|nr:Bifunctional lysine-specific demethylase and histidyl-hydroxylase [Aphelenchoides bicaudatus]